MSLIIFLLINVVGLILVGGLLIAITSDKSINYISKIPNILRWLLLPFFSLLGLALIEASIRFLTEALSVFWPSGDVYFNVLFSGYLLIPLLGTYGLCWFAHLMAPSFQFTSSITIGVIYVSLNIFFFFADDFTIYTDVIVERMTQNESAGVFGSFVFIAAKIAGLWISYNSAKNDSFWSY